MGNSGGIKNITLIGGLDVSNDVISMNTVHVSSESEAVEPSTCKVVLNNHDQMYGKAIVSGAFIPGHTRIQSIIIIERNVVNGLSLSVVTTPYILFVGVVNDASYTNEMATIECVCESGFGSQSAKDRSWTADTLLSQKALELLEDENGQVGSSIVLEDRTTSIGPKKSQYIPSKLSYNEAFRAICTQSSKDFYFCTDEDLESKIILCDENTYYGNTTLDPFVVEPGDATCLIGYANDVTVIPENVMNIYEKANIPDPQKSAIQGHAQDEDGIETYGLIVAPIAYDPGIYSQEDADERAQALVDWYGTFIDRGIKVKVCSMIPLVRSIVSFTVPDVKNSTGSITVSAGVNKKMVEYSSNGVLVDLECSLIERSGGGSSREESAPPVTETPQEEPIPIVTPPPVTSTTSPSDLTTNSTIYTTATPVYDALTHNMYSSFQGKLDGQGNIAYKAIGIDELRKSTSTGWDYPSANVPTDAKGKILIELTT